MDEDGSPDRPVVSVVTATKGRPHLLADAYASVAAQEGVAVEWVVVVDDGACEETASVLSELSHRGEVAMRWERSPGRGVQAARNAAIRAARGKFVMILDDDDELLPGAVAALVHHWAALEDPDASLGVLGRCVNEDGQLVGAPMSRPVIDATWQEFNYRMARDARGERRGIMRRSVLARTPFPDDGDGEYRVEGTLWRELGRRFRTRYVDDVVYRFREKAATDRVTGMSGAYDRTTLRASVDVLNEDISYLRYRPLRFLLAAVAVTYHGLRCGVGLREQRGMLEGLLPAVLWAALCPLGVFAHLAGGPVRAIRGRGRRVGSARP